MYIIKKRMIEADFEIVNIEIYCAVLLLCTIFFSLWRIIEIVKADCHFRILGRSGRKSFSGS